MRFIQTGNEKVPEGLIVNKYFENKLIKKNQNIIFAVTGSTGSGKSYFCLSMVNNWYNYYFKKDFPMENVCFSIEDIMQLLNSKKLKRGEIIIMEEGGVLMNSLNFQDKISKLFTFVLQSFRSMNIGLIINLPVLTMLNKSARLLLHAHFTTAGINYQEKTNKCKPYFHQLNQTSGKSYWKFLHIKHDGSAVKVKKISYSLCSDDLIKKYEAKKFKFVADLNESFVKTLEERKSKENLKMQRNNLTEVESGVFNLLNKDYSVKEIAEITEVSLVSIYETIKRIEKKGYEIPKKKYKCYKVKKSKKSLGNKDFKGLKPN